MSLFCLSFVVEPGLITLLSARTYALFKQQMNHFRLKDRNLNILVKDEPSTRISDGYYLYIALEFSRFRRAWERYDISNVSHTGDE